MTLQDLLNAGIEAYQSGDIVLAQSILSKAVFADSTNATAWLWLGRAMDDVEKKRFCFQRAVNLDDTNLVARKALEELAPPEPSALPPQATPAAPAEEEPAQPAEPIATPAETEPPSQPPAVPARSKGSRKPLFWVLFAILLIGVLAGGIALAGKVAGSLSRMRAAQVAVISTPTPTVTVAPPTPTATIPTPTPTATRVPPTRTPTFTPTRRPLSTNTPTPTPNGTEIAVRSTLLAKGSQFSTGSEGHSQYLQAAHKCETTTANVSDPSYAAFERSICYWDLIQDLPVGDDYLDALHRGLYEIGQAIDVLGGTEDPNDYAMRALLISQLDKEFPNRVDDVQIYQAALEDYQSAEKYDPNNVRWLKSQGWMQVDMGYCADGLLTTNRVLNKVPGLPQTDADLDELLAEVYACQGQNDQASKYIDMGIQAGNACNCQWEKGLYLYLTGHPEDAKTILSDYPASDDDRYFLIGLIDFEAGNTDAAKSDLQMGEQATWRRHGLHAYLEGKLALAAGDHQKAIQNFQDAEATLPHRQAQLLPKIQADLTKLGAKPLTPKVTFNLQAIQSTPMPTVALTPSVTPKP